MAEKGESFTSEEFIRCSIASYPHLLTAVQEIELLRKCQSLCDVLECNLGERKISLTAVNKIKKANEQIVKEGLAAREVVITANRRLAIDITNRTLGQLTYLSDFYQEAFTGLARAIESFDCSKGFRFTTYAVFWIKQKILTYYHSKYPFIKVPPDYRLIRQKYHSLMALHKRLPFVEAHNKTIIAITDFIIEDKGFGFKLSASKLALKRIKIREKIALSLALPEVYSAEECPQKIERIPYSSKANIALDLELHCTLNPLQALFFEEIVEKIMHNESLNAEEAEKIELFTASFR